MGMDDVVLKTSPRQLAQGRQTRDRLVEAIRQFIAEHGYSPTVRELGDLVGLKSTASVHFQLRALAIEKRITWKPEQPRTVRPTIPPVTPPAQGDGR
jgi:SOS-response transcriptional repressor LexA